jgi:hypothetical protein
VFVEDGGGQDDGSHEFEVEEQRRRRSGGARQAGGQEYRGDGAPEQHRDGQAAAAGAQRASGWWSHDRGGEHGESRSEIEQTGEGEGVHVSRQLGRGGRGGAEQDGRREAADDGSALHRSMVPARGLVVDAARPPHRGRVGAGFSGWP